MTTSVCPKCGTPLEPDSSEPCAVCLLQLAVQSDSMVDSLSEALPGTVQVSSQTLDIDVVRRAFPQLEIIEQIGRGGMGTVFKARQPKLDRFVAVKILSEKLAEKPTFAERFAQEGKLLARLNHPNIVAVYDFGQTETTDDADNKLTFFFLILEYVDGVNLRQAMREERFTPDQALAIVPKICEALQYAHDEGVLHRDIKPENILLDTKGRIKIADFGIASFNVATNRDLQSQNNGITDSGSCESERLTEAGQILGTPNYMAPEQLETPNSVDHRADIYSLGVVFYELLTGELPKGSFAVPSEKTPVGAEIDDIVLKALKRDRTKRHQSADELKTEIETATMATVAQQKTRTSKTIEGNPQTRTPLWAILVLAMAFMYFLPSLAMLGMYVIDLIGGGEDFRDGSYGINDIIFSLLPVLVSGTVIWILWQKQPKNVSPTLPQKQFSVEQGNEQGVNVAVEHQKNDWFKHIPLIAIILIGLIIPLISSVIGAKVYNFPPWFYGMLWQGWLLAYLFQSFAIIAAVVLYKASQSFRGILRYLAVICGYAAFFNYYFSFDISSDAQAALAIIFFPIYSIFFFIIGYFAALLINYVIVRRSLKNGNHVI